MIATQLIQLKVPLPLKETLQKMAEYKGISLSAFLKMILTEITRAGVKASSFSTSVQIPETNDPEDEFLAAQESKMTEVLEKYLQNPKNITEIIRVK